MAAWKWGGKESVEAESEEPEESETENSNTKEDAISKEDLTWCHRMTVCSPMIRNRLITDHLSKCYGFGVTWADLFRTTSNAGLASIVWAVLYFLLGDTMLPKNEGFGLYVLVILSCLFGRFFAAIPYSIVPPVLGMLLAGLIVRNTGLYDIREDLGLATTSKIRTFCLTFVTIRAGLQLSTTSLRRNPILVIALATIPCTIEMLVLSVCSRYLLSYPWDWSFMNGTILACMSPVVTVNCVLALAERGYGEDKGLATIICTAACIDNVHIVSLFVLCYSFVFANDKGQTEWWSYIPGGLRDAILGIAVGLFLGIFLVFFPHRSQKYVTCYRMICLVFASLMCTTATAKLTVSGGGYLASTILSFIAITGWKILSDSFDTTPFRHAAYILWQLVQPILVGVVGAEVNLEQWSTPRFGLHLLCILLGLTARSLATLFTISNGSFTWKERLFVVICWLPKGTLQAALGPMAFERIRNQADSETIEIAVDVIRSSVATILFLAPIGTMLINLSGPYLLNKVTEEQLQKDRELSYLRILSLQPLPTLSVRDEERKRVRNVQTA